MSNNDDVKNDNRGPFDGVPQVPSEIPTGVDRRKFIMRSAVISAAAVMTGCTRSETEQKAPPPAAEAPAAAAAPGAAGCRPERGDEGQGAGVDDRGRVLQGGPWAFQFAHDRPDAHYLRFYQQAAKLPADKLAKATKLQVNLFGSLSATGKGHGTERAALAGLVGKEPATVDPCFWTA